MKAIIILSFIVFMASCSGAIEKTTANSSHRVEVDGYSFGEHQPLTLVMIGDIRVVAPRGKHSLKLQYDIDKEGRIINLKIYSPSNYKKIDALLVESFKKSRFFPPQNRGLNSENQEVEISYSIK